MSRPRLIALLLTLVTLLAYLPAARDSFLNLDDDLYVTNNRVVQNGLTWAGVKWAFTTGHASNWHPLTWLSHMLDCELFGLNARAQHYINVLFHTANAVLLLWLLFRLTGALWPSALAAALFAWHPLFVESVAWIAERKNVLSTFFGLLALLAYSRYAQGVASDRWQAAGTKKTAAPAPDLSRVTRHTSLFYGLALGAFALGLLAKPMLVTLPFVMLLLDYWPLQRLAPSAFRLPLFLRLVLEKWPFFLLAAASCVITFLVQRRGGMVAMLQQLPLHFRLCNALRSYALFLWKTIWPAKLAILYPYPPQNQLPAAAVSAAAILLAVTWLVWRAHRRYPYLLVGWLWYLGTLVPVIGLVQVGAQAMTDHYAYVPLMGVFIAVAFGLKDLIARFQIGMVPAAAAAGLVLAGCLALTERQLSYWRNDESLFEHAIAVTENNGAAHNNLGVALAWQERPAEALANFQEAIRLNPRSADAHNNLGNLLRDTGNPEGALVEYRNAAQLKPNQPVMQDNLGEVLAELGRFDEALSRLQEAARLDPGYPRPHFVMGRVLLQQGRDAGAMNQFREALRLSPDNFETLAFTARVLAAEENPEVRDGKTALTLALKACALTGGRQPHALDVLGMAFAETGDFTNAQAATLKALQLATAARMKNLEPLRQQLELYKKGQPWRESFLSTNTPPGEIPKR